MAVVRETPHVQSVTVSGELMGCDGPLGFESAKYTDHLKTSEEVTCAALASAVIEPLTTPVSLSLKWTPHELGTSHGALLMPISELAITGMSGTLEGGPFATPTTVGATSVYESFTGARQARLFLDKRRRIRIRGDLKQIETVRTAEQQAVGRSYAVPTSPIVRIVGLE